MNLSLMAILVIPLLVTVGVAVHAWFQRPNRNAFAMFIFMLVTSVHLSLYLFQLVSSQLAAARFWMFAALPWSLLMGVSWLILALHVAGYERIMRSTHYVLLSIMPAIITLLAWTNRFHHLYGSDFRMETTGVFRLLVFEAGAVYWINSGFLALMISAGLIILVQTIIRRGRSNRWQAAWISIGVLIPAVTYLLVITGRSPIPGVNLAPFSFSVSGLALAASLFHYNFLEVAPLARATLFRNLQVGILIIDLENIVADANPAALEMLASISNVVIGQPINHVFPECAQMMGSIEQEACQDIEVIGPQGSTLLAVEISPLYDNTGQPRGRLINLHDITERRRVSQALRTSEENLRAILNSSSDSIILLDPDQRIILTNPVARQRASGVTQDEMRSGEPIMDFIPHSDQSEFESNFNKALSGEIVQYEKEVVGPGGIGEPGLWYEVLYNPVYTSSNALLGVSFYMYSIDDRKLAEKMLRESERRFRDYFEQGLVGMGVSSVEKKWIEVNNRLCEILGYSREELLSKPWLDFTHPQDRENNAQSYDRLVAGDINEYSYEKRYIHKNGQTVYCLISVRPYYLEDGTLDHTLAIVQDITPRKEALEKLGQAKEYAEQLFRVAPSGIFTVDTDCIITSMNSRAAEITGYLPEEAVGQHCNLFTRAPCGDFCGLYQYASPVRPINGAECFIETKDGRIRDILKNAEQLIDQNGQVVGGIESIEDITERKQVEQSERQQRQLAETLREVGLALTTQLDPEAVLDVLLEQINLVVPYDSINIMLLEENHLTIARQKGYDQFGTYDAISAVQTHIDDLAYFKVMQDTRKPVLVSETEKDPDWVVIEASKHVKSWLGAPVIVHGKLIGFLSIDKAQPGFYTDEHSEYITLLAAHAGLALENARLHAEKQYQASHDSLTSLPNRMLFFDRLHHALLVAHRNKHRAAILFIDLDGFKAINDTHGHDAGDWLLKEVALRLANSIRGSDTVARMGGDEFTIILEKLSKDDDPIIVAEKVRSAILEPYQRDETEMHVSASIGISFYPDHGHDADLLVKKADEAMYRAKRSSKNKIALSE